MSAVSALRGAVRQADIDDGDGRRAITHAQFQFIRAGGGDLLGRAFAVIEGPRAQCAWRQRADNADADAMVRRRHEILALAVALAGFRNLSGLVDAEIADHVACPAAPVGRARQPLLGREHAVAARCRRVAAEIGLVTEQAETVLYFPFDAQIARHRDQRFGGRGGGKRARLRERRSAEERPQQDDRKGRGKKRSHD